MCSPTIFVQPNAAVKRDVLGPLRAMWGGGVPVAWWSAVTEGGKLRPAARPAALTKMLKGMTAHMALSGRTMEFDGNGKCVAGC